MKKKITIPYFHVGLKYVTPLFFGAGIYLVTIKHPVWGGLAMLAGAIVLTTHYATEINLEDKTYRDYLSMLGIPFNEDKKKFNSLDRIVISRGSYSQMVNTRIQSRQMDWIDYTGTLVLDNDTLDLLTRNDKEDLLKGLKEFAEFLKVGVEDRTTQRPYWVDMSKIK